MVVGNRTQTQRPAFGPNARALVNLMNSNLSRYDHLDLELCKDAPRITATIV